MTLYTYVLAKILQNGYSKGYKKGDSVFLKSHEKFEQLQTNSGKSKKLKFGWLLSKTYIPSAKTFTEDLSNIIFKYLCENSLNYLSNF